MTHDFSGAKVLITGGTKGLGRATAVAFLTHGAAVTICARNAPEAPVTGTDAAGVERSAHLIACDVRDHEAVAALAEATATHMGGIDILINNAGGAPAAQAKDSGGSFNSKIVGLNLLAPMNLSIACYPHLRASESGVVINVSSVSGMRANPLGVAYGAAKAGLVNMTKTLALEWGPDVRVLTVSAGPLLTDGAADHFGAAEVTRLSDAVAMKRLGSSDDIVSAILFACSSEASWMTGSNLVIDGGPVWPGNGYARPTEAS